MPKIKRIVRFTLPVEFRADNLQGLREAIKSFREDPCYMTDTYDCDYGHYGWTQGKPQVKRKR